MLVLDVVAPTLSNFSMSTNWELCLFCQEKTRNEKERGEISSYFKIETKLKRFIDVDPTYIEWSGYSENFENTQCSLSQKML